METHAHHLHKAPGKNFQHYFFEFLMLFIAVFCGFLAENYREARVEHTREKEYMKALIKDLDKDIENLDTAIAKDLVNKRNYDSVFYLLSLPDYSDKTGSIYYLGRQVPLRQFFYMTDGTVKQLLNSGGLRLVRDQQVVDSLNSYRQLNEQIERGQSLKEIMLSDYRTAAIQVFDVRIFEEIMQGVTLKRPKGNPRLFSDNPKDINELLMRIHFVKRNNASLLLLLGNLRQKAITLKTLIKGKYHLD